MTENKENWNKEHFSDSEKKQRKEGKENKKTFADILKEKAWPLIENYLKTTVKDAAVVKFQETEEKVIKGVDEKIKLYRNKATVWILLLLGAVMITYSFFEIFFKNIGYEEWTNFGAGAFFIFVSLIIYFIGSFKEK